MTYTFYTSRGSHAYKLEVSQPAEEGVLAVRTKSIGDNLYTPSDLTLDLNALPRGGVYQTYLMSSLEWSPVLSADENGKPRMNASAEAYYSRTPDTDGLPHITAYLPSQDDGVHINIAGATLETDNATIPSPASVILARPTQYNTLLAQDYPEFRKIRDSVTCEVSHAVRLLPLRTLEYQGVILDVLARIVFRVLEQNPALENEIFNELPIYTFLKDIMRQHSFYDVKQDEWRADVEAALTADCKILKDFEDAKFDLHNKYASLLAEPVADPQSPQGQEVSEDGMD